MTAPLPPTTRAGRGIDRDFIARIAEPGYCPFMAAKSHAPAPAPEQQAARQAAEAQQAEAAQQMADAKREERLVKRRIQAKRRRERKAA